MHQPRHCFRDAALTNDFFLRLFAEYYVVTVHLTSDLPFFNPIILSYYIFVCQMVLL